MDDARCLLTLKRRGDLPFDKCRLYGLLTNVLYAGKVTHKNEVFDGEHEAIVPEDVFRGVQTRLQRNGRSGSPEFRNRYGALLRRLLYCKACNRAMVHTFTTRGKRRYRYYTCTNAIKSGRRKCPTKSLPAAEIENAIVDQIRCVGRDPELVRETLLEAHRQNTSALERLAGERRLIERGLTRWHAEIRRSVTCEPLSPTATARVADLNEQMGEAERHLAEIETKTTDLRTEFIEEADVVAGLADFGSVWQALIRSCGGWRPT